MSMISKLRRTNWKENKPKRILRKPKLPLTLQSRKYSIRQRKTKLEGRKKRVARDHTKT